MTNGEPSNAEIMEYLGRLSAQTELLLADRTESRDSRRLLHEKMDASSARHAELSEALAVTREVAAQARDNAQSALANLHRFESEFREVQLPIISSAQAFRLEAEPVLRSLKVIRAIILAFFGTGLVSFASLVAAALFAREQLGIVLRWALGL